MNPNDPASNPHLVTVDAPDTWKEKWKRLGASAMAISILVHTTLILLFIFVFVTWIKPKQDPPPDFEAAGGGGGGSPSATKVMAQARKTSTNMAESRRVAAATTSDFTLPEPSEDPMPATLASFEGGAGQGGSGSGGGKGNGTGTGFGNGTGPGSGNGHGHLVISKKLFFDQPVIQKSTVFVLDFSRSMEESGRKDILIKELQNSMDGLDNGIDFQVIMFAGYAWLPGDSVDLAADQMSATVTDKSGKVFNWIRPSRDNFQWFATDDHNKKGFLRPVAWQKADEKSVSGTIEDLRSTKLQMNTSWDIPLEMALAMKPAPEVIFFMTDGITSDGDAEKSVKQVIAKAKTTKTAINTISMMEPTEIKAMQELARETGGGFSIVAQDGTSKQSIAPRNTGAPAGGLGKDLR